MHRAHCLLGIPPDITAKGCPCVDGFLCNLASRQCAKADAGPDKGLGCVIYTDGKLYCANPTGIELHEIPDGSSKVVNRLVTTYSWFLCWGSGEPLPDGHTTCFFTDGDIRGAPEGWLPSTDVATPAAFNADPAAYGFLRCP